MTPQQKVKALVIAKVFEWHAPCDAPTLTAENVDEFYDRLDEIGDHQEALNDIREGDVVTDLPCEYSRNYEAKAVAAKAPDGSWVGWTYWFGGGKHGAPEEIEWVSDAYDLDCREEEKFVTVRTFSKVTN